MPKYYDFMICGYYLYFTSHCIVEAMHVHASDRRLTESGSAKLFVMGNGDTIVKEQGVLTNKELRIIREFVKDNYQEMFLKWSEMSNNGFYRENNLIKVYPSCPTHRASEDTPFFF